MINLTEAAIVGVFVMFLLCAEVFVVTRRFVKCRAMVPDT